jgi:thiol:disulfide interchange protein DsbD
MYLKPCVFPIIRFMILTISQDASSPGRRLFLWMLLSGGVVAFWSCIGITAAVVSGAAVPSRIFGIWWLPLGIGLLIAFMGIGIMGLFTIQLPAAVYAVNPKAETAWGSFLFGVMTAVLGLPCFGFVAGALLAGAATLPASTVMLVFASIGVGMAAPYLVLSAKPSLLRHLPRTGPASELVKQVMGLLLLAAGAYFIGSGLIALISEAPYLGRQLHWWVVSLLAVAAGFWLIVRTFQISSKAAPRAIFSVVGLAIGALAVLFSLDSTAKAKLDWHTRQTTLESSTGGYASGAWNEFSLIAFDNARASGAIVVLDFTAEWCLTCKALKATVLNREPVKGALAESSVVGFTVDLTSTSAPGWQMLRDLGRTGIPLLAIYTPGEESPWLANAYTADQVMAALADAHSRTVAQR